MFENLLNLVKENAGDVIINNPAIPNQHNDEAIKTATTGIMDHLKGLTSGGGVESIMNLFKGGNVMNNPEVAKISSSVASTLSSKFGIDQAQARSIVEKLIPTVMSQLASKTNDPKDSSFTLEGITGSLTKGMPGGIGGLGEKIGGLFGR